MSELQARIRTALERVHASGRGAVELADAAVGVASDLLALSRAHELKSDLEQRLRLARMVSDPDGCALTTLFTDRVPRALSPHAAVHAGQHLLRHLGVPQYFGNKDRILLRAFAAFGGLQPALTAAGVRRYLRQETARYLAPDTAPELEASLQRLRAGGVQVNVNHLGEEILSAEEADSHLGAYERLLACPEVSTVSVKISSVCERLNPLAFEDSVVRICGALRRVYRAAGSGAQAKRVMLDMEAYKDLALSLEAFQRVASQAEFAQARLGIVLQAYIPDSHAALASLAQWASHRVAAGGQPIRVRLVKGANLAMEQVLDEQRGWACPVYPSKLEVDASFRKLLEFAAAEEHAQHLVVGVGSHNLFDVALTLLLRSSLGGEGHTSFEILAGMAEPLRRALVGLGQPVLVYCPTVSPDAYHTAVAYLVRRLDENTTAGNFLCSEFGMSVGDAAWQDQETRFRVATASAAEASTVSRRQPASLEAAVGSPDAAFENAVDTDFCLSAERQRLEQAIGAVRGAAPEHLELSIAGRWQSRPGAPGFDPSQPGSEPYYCSLAGEADVEAALAAAEGARARLASIPVRERARWLLAAAAVFRAHRFELIAHTMRDGGKIAAEADAEVSEAIDFAEYYARTAVAQAEWSEVRVRPRGVAVVAPPWNFPLAIPLGGCFAALSAGNPVIVKPARETPGVATVAVKLCYEAGIPPEFLQLVVAEDRVATPLVTDPRVRSVILTGASDTARMFRRLRPDIYLLAETGGKNTVIVTEHADIDAAVAAVTDSAFGHSGQKCSAASLLIVVEQVVRGSDFIPRLVAATRSRRVRGVWDLAADQGPLIHPPEGPLREALEASRAEGDWLLRPEVNPHNPRLMSPGIRDHVAEGSLLHTTELFGPVLGIMRAKSLRAALHLANETPYGLTAGLLSLDEGEQREFLQKMDAGNLYVNRATTGAIVQRQPFGGRKTSSFGPGSKAGGPNYTLELVDITDRRRREVAELPSALQFQLGPIAEWLPERDREAFWSASGSYQRALRDHFAFDHDPAGLRSQRNVFRYQPAQEVLLWVGRSAPALDLALTLSALAHCQVRFDLALLEEDPEVVRVASMLGGNLRRVLGVLGVEPPSKPGLPDPFAGYRRVRCLGQFPESVYLVKNRSDAYFERARPLLFGRVELLRYFLEQTVSVDVHRYGNLQPAALCPVGRGAGPHSGSV